ncbi:MAG: hypothetical protein NZ558_08250 [Blastocatellia bacterium]|nr:hypothetical protein [Blastocatellia bacterium]
MSSLAAGKSVVEVGAVGLVAVEVTGSTDTRSRYASRRHRGP